MDKFDNMPYKALINECKDLGINFVGKSTEQLRQELRKLDKSKAKEEKALEESKKETIEKDSTDEVIEKVEEQTEQISEESENVGVKADNVEKKFKSQKKIDNIVEENKTEQSQIKLEDTVLFRPKGGESKIKGKIIKIYVYEKNRYTYNKILGEDGKKYDKQAKDIELCNN